MARTSGVAVTKILTSASGHTTVPMSRPSSTAPRAACGQRHAGSRAWLPAPAGCGPRWRPPRRRRGRAGPGRRAWPGRAARAAATAAAAVVQRAAAPPHVARDGAIEQAGVEMGEAELRGDALGQRALARSRRTIDGDDHGLAPRLTARSPAARGRAQALHQAAELGEAGGDHGGVVDRDRPVGAEARASGRPWRCDGRGGWRPCRRRARPCRPDDQRVAFDLGRQRRWRQARPRWPPGGRSPSPSARQAPPCASRRSA